MWSRCLLLSLFIVVGALTAGADEPSPATSGPQNEQEPFQPVDEIDSMIKKLIRAVDLWHDANLKGDRSLIHKHSQTIFTILEADLRSSRKEARQNRRMADSLETAAVRKRAEQSATMSRVKAHLIRSMRSTEAFSNRYRLLGDYLEVLKMEREGNSVELADRNARAAADEE